MDPRAPHMGEIIQDALHECAPGLPELTPDQRAFVATAALDAMQPADPNWRALGVDETMARS